MWLCDAAALEGIAQPEDVKMIEMSDKNQNESD